MSHNIRPTSAGPRTLEQALQRVHDHEMKAAVLGESLKDLRYIAAGCVLISLLMTSGAVLYAHTTVESKSREIASLKSQLSHAQDVASKADSASRALRRESRSLRDAVAAATKREKRLQLALESEREAQAGATTKGAGHRTPFRSPTRVAPSKSETSGDGATLNSHCAPGDPLCSDLGV